MAYNVIVIPEKTQAQRSSDSLQIKSYELDDVIVTAERTPVEAQQAACIVTVITKSEIERSPAQNLNNLLRYVAGVDIRQRGPLGAQADIRIHGGTFDQTLILLNGVNIADPQTGHHNSDLTGFRIYPGIDVSYRLNDYFKLYSSANKTLRRNEIQ